MFEYFARVHEIIDGDTLDVSIDLGFNIQHIIRLRLYGIDTPEKKSKSNSERELAKLATKKLTELIEGKIVTVKTHKTSDKYGRYLAEVFHNGTNINKLLLAEGFAKEYYGGKKNETF
jgi:micrococcal nuclease